MKTTSGNNLKTLLITTIALTVIPWPFMWILGMNGASVYIGWVGFSILCVGALLGIYSACRLVVYLKKPIGIERRVGGVVLVGFFLFNAFLMGVLLYAVWMLRDLN